MAKLVFDDEASRLIDATNEYFFSSNEYVFLAERL